MLIFFSANVNAQFVTMKQAEAYARDLVKHGFLTAKGQALLLQKLKPSHVSPWPRFVLSHEDVALTELSRQNILQFCSRAMASERNYRLANRSLANDKIPNREHVDDFLLTSTYSWGIEGEKSYYGCISPNISTTGHTRQKTLAIFLATGLINQKIFNECQAALRRGQFATELELLRYMTDRSNFYRSYLTHKEEEARYITGLAKHGILSRESAEALLKSSDLLTHTQILKHSPRFVLVDLHAYQPNPQETYPVIFEAVKKLLPEFKYSSLAFQIQENDEGTENTGTVEQYVKLSFVADGNRYFNTFFNFFRPVEPLPSYRRKEEAPRVAQGFHKGINKWLTDRESPYRLYTYNILDADEDERYGTRSVGLLLLKKGEEELITQTAYELSEETFDLRLSRKNLRKMLTAFRQKGFFSHLSPAEIESAEKKIADLEINTFFDVLHQFPGTTVFCSFWTDGRENPYEQLTKQFMAASKGAIKVSNITDEFKKGLNNKGPVKYGFTMNGKRYEKMLKFFGEDRLDGSFLKLLKSAMAENKIDGNFYYCVEVNNWYIFLTSAQHKFIMATWPDLLVIEDDHGCE